MKSKALHRASSLIAEHYGLRWLDRTLTLNHWESVGSLCNLFFVSVYNDSASYLYLIDRSEVCVWNEGIRNKLPCFYFTPQMAERAVGDGSRVWYVSIGDELVRIRSKDFTKLSARINIKIEDDGRHWFDQDIIGSDIEVKQEYLPRRGKVRKQRWLRHLKSARRTLPEPSL